jgi:hypothetical protein
MKIVGVSTDYEIVIVFNNKVKAAEYDSQRTYQSKHKAYKPHGRSSDPAQSLGARCSEKTRCHHIDVLSERSQLWYSVQSSSVKRIGVGGAELKLRPGCGCILLVLGVVNAILVIGTVVGMSRGSINWGLGVAVLLIFLGDTAATGMMGLEAIRRKPIGGEAAAVGVSEDEDGAEGSEGDEP